MKKFAKTRIVILSAVGILLFGTMVLAQTSTPAPDPAEQAQLQQQLLDIEKQISNYQAQLKTIQGQKNTLLNKIKQLQTQQARLTLQIKAINLQIADLTVKRNDTQTSITLTQNKIELLQQQIAQAMRLVNENDRYPILYTVVAKQNLSDVFDRVQDYAQISEQLHGLLGQTVALKNDLTQHEQELSDQQDQAKNLLSIQSIQQQQLAATVGDQTTLLQQTKGQEADYQITLNDTRRRANEIRTRLYQLLGVSQQINFGDAVKIAQWASGQSGVRAAFLLAILTQESNLGKNVGTCNRPGDPPEKSYKVVMHPTRDVPLFVQITGDLGRDPDITPVSCPMKDSKGRQVGWGGAMGPAQFIPSTWIGYKDQVAQITGKPADPWDIRDAFLASALKLAAGGATSQDGEWAAAMRYFSGGTNTKYRFYGDNVVATAAQYQSDIDQLK